LGVVALLGLLV